MSKHKYQSCRTYSTTMRDVYFSFGGGDETIRYIISHHMIQITSSVINRPRSSEKPRDRSSETPRNRSSEKPRDRSSETPRDRSSETPRNLRTFECQIECSTKNSFQGGATRLVKRHMFPKKIRKSGTF